MSGKLDFRNLTTTQFDPGQTQKMAFSEYQSAYKQFNTNAILKQPYTHFIQTLDSQDRPTRVEYYQATAPAKDRINVRADSGGDLAGTYILLTEYISKKTYVYYFVVSGSGSAPKIGDVETAVEINNNDPQSLVAFALKNELRSTEEFKITSSTLLSGNFVVEYMKFGETSPIDVSTTGFVVERIEEGDSFLVGEVELTYNEDGSPIYNGNVLRGLLYNPYTASFDVERHEVKVTIADQPLTSSTVYDKQALDVNIADQVIWDEIATTFPDTVTDIYTYSYQGAPVQTVTVTYGDTTKNQILNVVKEKL